MHRVRRICLCLVQLVKAARRLAAQAVSVSLLVSRERVCLLDLAKLVEQPRQATLDSPRLLVTGHRARVPQLPLAAERSSGSQP
jgi:hypothetical protein